MFHDSEIITVSWLWNNYSSPWCQQTVPAKGNHWPKLNIKCKHCSEIITIHDDVSKHCLKKGNIYPTTTIASTIYDSAIITGHILRINFTLELCKINFTFQEDLCAVHIDLNIMTFVYLIS